MDETITSKPQSYSRGVTDLAHFPAQVHRLPHLTIELTDRCNNNCQHCYINRPALDAQALAMEMETEFIKDLIMQAAGLGCLDLRFTGGEPLLRDDFPELYTYSRKNGFKVLLYTNARLITQELVDLFKMRPPGQSIGITVYGMRPETYDRISGVKGSYEEFRLGIDLLEKNQIDFGLKMAVLPDNRDDVPAYEEWIKRLFKGKQTPAYIANFSQRARHDDPGKNQRIRELRGEPQENIDLVACIDGYSGELHDFCRQFTGRKSDKLFTCGFGQAISIDAYGNAQGCLLLRHPDLLYDLHSGTLAAALTDFFPDFAQRRATHPLFLSHCAQCVLRGLCEQCPAQSWMEHGTLDTPADFQCQLAHAHARQLGLLTADEKGWEISDWQTRLETRN